MFKKLIIPILILTFIIGVNWKRIMRITDVRELQSTLDLKMLREAFDDSLNAKGSSLRDSSESAIRDSMFVVNMHNLDTTGLVLYFPLDDTVTSTGTIFDYSGHGNNGTNGGAEFKKDSVIIGLGAISLCNDSILINDVLTDLATTTTGTWEAWVKPVDATPAAVMTIISFGDIDASHLMQLSIDVAGKLDFYILDTVQRGRIITDNAVFSDNTKTYVAIVHTGTEYILYVNGIAVPQTQSVYNSEWFNSITGLDNGRIGCNNYNNLGNANFFHGLIDEVIITERALSALEIYNNYNNAIANNLLLTKTDKNADETIQGHWTFGNITVDTLNVGDIEESFVFFSMNDTVPTTIATAGSYVQFAGTFTMKDSLNFEFNNLNMAIIYTGTLDETVIFHFDMSSNTDHNGTIAVRICHNLDTLAATEVDRKIKANELGAFSTSAILHLSTSDSVRLVVTDKEATGDLTLSTIVGIAR